MERSKKKKNKGPAAFCGKKKHGPLGAKQTELLGKAIEALSAQLTRLHPSRTETNLTNARLPAETTTTQAQCARTEAIIKKHIHDDEEVLGDQEGHIGFEHMPMGQSRALAPTSA